MKVLVTGGSGQLGSALVQEAPADVALIVPDRAMLDLAKPEAIRAVVATMKPDWIINTAAYTHVDRAESERDMAFRVNAEAVQALAEAARDTGARMLQVSTDFVFDGTHGVPYAPGAIPSPLNVYGQTKLAGEHAVLSTLGTRALVVRTAWLYASHGRNFVRTVLDIARKHGQLRVVSDQVGAPTWATGLAQAIWRMVALDLSGIHHWTDAGVASWYDVAVAVLEESSVMGLVDHGILVTPISSDAFPSQAKRPSYSVLDKTATWSALSLVSPHWRHNLRSMLRELKNA
ncbi:MAG: dTDP-4-dehydrorhamnose reductase [Acidiferrobacteraceae bacterium]